MSLAPLDALNRDFTGDIVRPGDPGYRQAGRVYAVQSEPALLIRPRTADDVAVAIRYARDASLALSVRGGGHHFGGLGTNDGGVVIDLSELSAIEVVDPVSRVVRLGPGAVWADVARRLRPYGMALTSGDTGSVGVGGLTLGGGIGWLVRHQGLAIDNLRAAEIVTADGKQIRAGAGADADEHEDLFWAIRGGGGNFGVVTAFEFTASPLDGVFAGEIDYPGHETAEVLKRWRDEMRSAPERLNSTVRLAPPLAGTDPVARVRICYAGTDEAAATAAIDPLRRLGTVLSDTVRVMAYPDVLDDALTLDGIRLVVRSRFADAFDDDLVAAIAGNCGRPGSAVTQVRGLGGAVRRVAPDATAFAHRASEILLIAATPLPLTASSSDVEATLRRWRAMSAPGGGAAAAAYANFTSDTTDAETRRVYPPRTYRRLAEIKQTYDPHNVFRRNINIPPAATDRTPYEQVSSNS
ncbi:MAG TPA: FAD-binding oxidoreductase [Streptosporangiaceae bacterium]|nr:FAD-binding oxidoreductase [Streptosporangiaceae bacterium]